MEKIPVLDHGYIALVESWGTDERIVEAARMSTGKGFLRWDAGPCPICTTNEEDECGPGCASCEGKGHVAGDMKLLQRLWLLKHHTPFEMGGLIVEVQAPILVFREWHRHRTQSYNEMSARYVPLPDVNYVPTVERLMMNAGTSNKQAGTVKGAAELTTAGAQRFREILELQYRHAEAVYQDALTAGVPKELARVHLPVGRYSRMRASANLRNWLGFLTLRDHEAAQWEIRQYAAAVSTMVRETFPRTHSLFVGEVA